VGNAQPGGYYFAPPSHWPLVGSAALLLMAFGGVMLMNSVGGGGLVFGVGSAILVYMLFGWFGTVIRESQGGCTTSRWTPPSAGA
jgi:cytochrome c oxidase subunit 3